jgi:hypothetical protein
MSRTDRQLGLELPDGMPGSFLRLFLWSALLRFLNHWPTL